MMKNDNVKFLNGVKENDIDMHVFSKVFRGKTFQIN